MKKTSEKIIVRNMLLNIENFDQIEKFLVKYGEEVIWSNLYGYGLQYKTENISIIYSSIQFVHSKPVDVYLNPRKDFAAKRFFFIDIYPEKNDKQSYARCDAKYTFQIQVHG